MLTTELAQYLDTHGLVVFDETGCSGNCFLESLPEQPDLAVALYVTGGRPPALRQTMAYPSVRLLVRGTRDPRGAYELARALLSALHGLHQIDLTPGGTHVYLCLAEHSAPLHHGVDANDRHLYAVELTLHTDRV